MCGRLTLDPLRNHTQRGPRLLQVPQHALVLCSTGNQSFDHLDVYGSATLDTTDQERCLQAWAAAKCRWVAALASRANCKL